MQQDLATPLQKIDTLITKLNTLLNAIQIYAAADSSQGPYQFVLDTVGKLDSIYPTDIPLPASRQSSMAESSKDSALDNIDDLELLERLCPRIAPKAHMGWRFLDPVDDAHLRSEDIMAPKQGENRVEGLLTEPAPEVSSKPLLEPFEPSWPSSYILSLGDILYSTRMLLCQILLTPNRWRWSPVVCKLVGHQATHALYNKLRKGARSINTVELPPT